VNSWFTMDLELAPIMNLMGKGIKKYLSLLVCFL